ncbi:hypothetical protein NKH95_17555 [Mesorhizobium sp. M0848]|uniref:hypothetical protein n=1 Tax=Mesorhizobium sp. M0848 TaxID=2957012 RepID=UPI0033353E4E
MAVRTWIRNRGYVTALKIAAKKPVPERLFITGSSASGNDCVHIRFYDPANQNNEILVDGLGQVAASGHYYNEPTGGAYACSIPRAGLQDFGFKAEHYFKGHRITTTEAWRFVLSQWTFYHWIYHLKDRWAQARFNRRPLVRQGRIDVLRYFVSNTIEKGGFTSDRTDLIWKLYSLRSFRHPDREATTNYYGLILQSLVQSGELDQEAGNYRLSVSGISGLIAYELEERRFKQNARLQAILAVLTGVLILVGLAQVVVSYLAVPAVQ